MEIIIKIFQGALLIASGIALIKFRREIDNWFGGLDFAEKILGPGGTMLFMVLFGSFLTFSGVIVWAGGFDVIGNAIASIFGK